MLLIFRYFYMIEMCQGRAGVQQQSERISSVTELAKDLFSPIGIRL